jgi:D-tyrosyl-tRNA(Tyr) deacylase
MRVLIQRVLEAQVSIEAMPVSTIGDGLLLLAGFEENDNEEDLKWVASKICQLRIFNDEFGVMNKSLLDTGGNILLVSQFTLHASVKKGNRPSYLRAAKPDLAIPLYENMIKELEHLLGKTVQTGVFGADMKVSLINDGPVTIWIDSKQRE